jgi:predicted metal-dependent peptidase
MVEFAPSTGGLALWIHHVDVAAEDGPPVRTDGRVLYYSAAFSQLPLPDQIGLLAHEVLHVALRHAQRYCELAAVIGEVDLELFNRCADAIVNSTLGHLGWLRLPRDAIRLEHLLRTVLGVEEPVEKSLLEWDVERLYRAMDDRRTGSRGGRRARRTGGDGNATNAATASRAHHGDRSRQLRATGPRFDQDLVPGPATLGPPEAEAQESREWSERISRAHAGDGEFSMLRALIADVPRSRTPWEQVLRTRLARALAPKRAASWSRPSRSYLANQGRSGGHRMPWEPGTSATTSTPRLVVIVDVSGSIEDELLERFAGEIDAITRRLESDLVLVIGDDRVRRVSHHVPGRSELASVEFEGRGGTDFTPLLEEAGRHDPDITVVLTDLDGPARFQPRWPVLWAVPETRRNATAPFGRIVPLR